MSNKVGLFIVGAMKSGTSSLRTMIAAHPKINMCGNELHFFSHPDRFEKGEDWYHSHFDASREGTLWAEKSPGYSLTPEIASLIHTYNPDAKILWILRDPVERLISNFHHGKRNFHVKKTRRRDTISIEEAIENADALREANSVEGYLHRSQYDAHIGHYLKYFPKEQVHAVVFEEMLEDPIKPTKTITDWLGFDAMPEPVNFPHRNINDKEFKDRFPVSDELQAELRKILAPTIESIETFLGRSIPSWHAS